MYPVGFFVICLYIYYEWHINNIYDIFFVILVRQVKLNENEKYCLGSKLKI